MSNNYRPHAYQVAARDFVVETRRVMLLMDCGLGKTAICLEALDLNRDMLPALIVAPLRCVTAVWPAEIVKWGFDLSYSIVRGLDKELRLTEDTDIKIANYESLEWLVGRFKAAGRVPFQTIIFDESSRLKSPTSKRTGYAQAIAEHTPNRVLLTGTPIPQGYADLWAQVFMLDRGRAFGTYKNFLARAFTFDFFNRPQIKIGWAQRIEKTVAPMTFRGDANELLDMPELIEQTIRLELPAEVMERYDEVKIGFLGGLDDLAEHTVANYAPMRCLASGFLYRRDPVNLARTREDIHQTKLDLIEEIWNENAQKPTLVLFNFRGEREMLTDRFKCPFIDGTSISADADSLIARWNSGDLKMLAMQPLSVGFGLNLQHGGRHMIWMSLPDSGEVYTQTVARLHRQGQSGSVFVYRLVARETIEESIEGLLRKKLLTQANLLDAMSCSKYLGMNANENPVRRLLPRRVAALVDRTPVPGDLAYQGKRDHQPTVDK